MKIKTELLNLITGLLLVFSGFLNLFYADFAVAMSWIVFGAIYLVMDDYLQNKSTVTLLEKMTDLSRYIFSWVGLVGSIIITGYFIKIFWM